MHFFYYFLIAADFQTKIEKEKEHFQKLTEERQTKEEEYTLVLCNIKKEIKISTEKVKAIKEENENRLKELQKLLQMVRINAVECTMLSIIQKFDDKL